MKKSAVIGIIVALLLCLLGSALADVIEIPSLGLSIDLSEDYQSQNVLLQSVGDDSCVGISFYYLNYEILDPLLEEYQNAQMSNDTAAQSEAANAYTTALLSHYEEYFTILGVKTDVLDSKAAAYGIDESTESIGSNSTHSYFLIPGTQNSALQEEDRKLAQIGRLVAERIAASASVIEMEADDNTLPAFSTVDMNGNTVDGSIFAQADLIVMNIWGTYCGPCINEMPELAAWANELPDNVLLIGLIVDVSSTTDKTYAKAQKILSSSGVEFVNLLYNGSLYGFVSDISGTPTTLFLDRSGNQVHEPILGAYINQYKQAVAEILSR